MGQLFWGARFPGHPPGQMQHSGDPKCFSPFAKMDMSDPTAHFGYPMVNKPGSSVPGSSSSKHDTPRSAHSGHPNHHGHHQNGHHGNHHSSHHSIYPFSGHHQSHGINSSSKHRPDLGGLLGSNYNSPSSAHHAGSGSLSSSASAPYSHSNNGGPPPPLLPSGPPPPVAPPPPPSSNSSPTKTQNQERMKKCKAVFGQGQKELWCNKCRWKKKCVRYAVSSCVDVILIK